jgi:zinc protease
LVVTGRIDRKHVEEAVQRHFGSWRARGTALPPPPADSYTPKPGVYFVTLPFSQATVHMGQIGIPRLTPDYPQIDIFNEVFGSSGFGSRLMARVRTELGLSYGIYGAISPAVVKGTNYIFVQTKAESVAPAIEASLGVLEGLQDAPPTEQEVQEKKAAIRNSFVFNFDSPEEIAGRQARLELLKYPSDYDQTYLPKIEAVTPQEVSEVARKRWDPSQFVVVVVGSEKAYQSLAQQMKEEGSPLKVFDLKKLGFESALVGR